jgi:hypothetical protein
VLSLHTKGALLTASSKMASNARQTQVALTHANRYAETDYFFSLSPHQTIAMTETRMMAMAAAQVARLRKVGLAIKIRMQAPALKTVAMESILEALSAMMATLTTTTAALLPVLSSQVSLAPEATVMNQMSVRRFAVSESTLAISNVTTATTSTEMGALLTVRSRSRGRALAGLSLSQTLATPNAATG